MLSQLSLCLFALTSILIQPIRSANCFSGPHWQYYDTLYADAWKVRVALCSDSTDVSCSTDGGITMCKASFGNVQGGYAAPTKAMGLEYCWDAFDNTINQCIYSDQPGGFYTYNQAVFNIQPIQLENY
ncbi:hypothetical protein DL98DRAFT_585194 [Cadophora sp. DSE1049]|nr:hypothetical protein DL98DRAFT_585194 [Cadophora sp. DSE1049]